ncbi:hypothetical protein EIP86_009649 [Pleurotus ostreatoroseus]|nr:hypothetical protein EIP86_009649 [Pleurotus ostreatoroseus]
MHCFDTFLQRSQSHLLTINTHPERTQHANSERLLLQLSRCRSLLVDHGSPFYEQLFVDTHPWHQYAQTLESLTLGEYNDGNPYDRLPLLFQHELSALTSLTWSYWRRNSLAGVRCPYLTELVFRSEVALPWTQWLDFLRSTPLLQILDLGDAVNAEPLHPPSFRSLPDSVVHLPHLSALKLFNNRKLEEALGGSGELALFNHLEFPPRATIEFVTQQMPACFQILETIRTRLAQPLPRSRPGTAPTIIAIDYCDDTLDISVWHTYAVPMAICRQWQETLSHPPPFSLRLRCYTGFWERTTDDPVARLCACAAQLLDSIYPLHLLETLVFKLTTCTVQQTAQILQTFRQVFKKMTNVRTLHLQGYRVDELLESILNQSAASPHAGDDDDDDRMQDAAQGSSLLFPSLRIVTIQQRDPSASSSLPQSRDIAQIPSIDQIVNALQERRTEGECRIEVVHICARAGFDPLNRPTKYGGSCYEISDPLRPQLLPLLGSDSLSTLDNYLRSGTTIHRNGGM